VFKMQVSSEGERKKRNEFGSVTGPITDTELWAVGGFCQVVRKYLLNPLFGSNVSHETIHVRRKPEPSPNPT